MVWTLHLKSGSCENEYVKEAVLNLAEHIQVEMRENHDKIYRNFLARIGLTETEINMMQKSEATRKYESSFMQEFGTNSRNFFDSMTALSGRELFASVRNSYVKDYLLAPDEVISAKWWTLHEELEVRHFQSAIRPVIKFCSLDKSKLNGMFELIKDEIDRHIKYWDMLAVEAKVVVG